MPHTDISPADIEFIREQLGREPRGIVQIAARSADGIPLVLQMRSVVDNKPFPTLYWLSSKDLGKAIGSIETGGWVKRLEERLQDDEAFLQAYLSCQQAYVDKRAAQMLEEDANTLERIGLSETFAKYGIGGLADWRQIRCLHMQYAHHLADYNVVGAFLDDEFNLNELIVRR